METGMTDATVDQVGRYVLDGSDEDLKRLLSLSESFAVQARRAFRRVGVGPGWTVIDCGCGPVGALALLAELVGPAGRVVGIDFSEPTIQRARSVVAAAGLDNVELFAGDIHELDAAALGGPFDLAFTRAFLMHQADPARTLRRIAGLVRPGGWIVAHEPLASPQPRSLPRLDALATYWSLLQEVMERAGVPHEAIEGLPRAARAAGLDIVEADGFFCTQDPELGFEIHAGSLAAARERAVKAGIAAELIDDLVARLRAAKSGGYEWVTSPFLLDLVLRKPAA
jgi:ubiquinone/menaquinone biosynthesis C-methylase UbiE